MPHRSRRDWLYGIAGVLALSLAFTAQYLFTGELFTHTRDSDSWNWYPRYSLACLLLLIAIAVAAIALVRRHDPPDLLRFPTPVPPLSPELRASLGAAAACYTLTLTLYLAAGENLGVRLLWVSSIALLVVPLWVSARSEPSPRHWLDWLLVAALTLLGFGLRYWRLTELPSHVDNDIALMGTFGLRLIATDNYNWVGYSNSEHLLSYDQLMAWSMRLFGQDHYGVVVTSVIGGTLTLPLVYLLGRELFGRRVGLLAMALLTVCYTHIHFSRIMFGPRTTLFATLAVLAIFRGLNTRQPRWFALGGVTMGFCLLLYDSSRVVPVLALASALWLLLWRRGLLREHAASWLVFGLGALAGFGPMLGFMIQDFEAFVGRGNTVALWTEGVWTHSTHLYGTSDVFEILRMQATRTFLTFHLYGDGSPHFSLQRPLISGLSAALLVLGVGLSLRRLRDIRHFCLLAWIGLTFILGGVITYDPPYWPHLNIVLPAAMLLAALAADTLIEQAEALASRTGLYAASGLVTLAIAYTGVANWQMYYDYVRDNAGARIRMARYIASLPNDYNVYFVHNDVSWNEFAFQFFNRGTQGYDAEPEQLRASPPPLDRPLLFVLYDHQELAEFLQQQYPTGVLREHVNSEGYRVFVSFSVTPDWYVLHPAPPPPNPLTLPGWWLVALGLLLGAGLVGLQVYNETAADSQQHSLAHSQRRSRV